MGAYIKKNYIRFMELKDNSVRAINRKTPILFQFFMQFVSFQQMVKWIFVKH